jgi:hypothetical protein
MSCIAPVEDATVEAARLRRDLVPDRALVGTGLEAEREPRAGGLVLHPPQRRIGRLRRGPEVLAVAGAVPAPVLDAADRHPHARPGGHEDGHVEGPVLLGAEDLFALVEQDRDVGRVDDHEVVHGRAAVELLDDESASAAIGERDVLERGRRPEQRAHGERAVHVGRADAEGLRQEVAQRGQGRFGRGMRLLSSLHESRREAHV